VAEDQTWIGVAALGISAASMAWTGWLTFRNNQLKNEVELAKIENDKRDNHTDYRVDRIWKSNLRRGSIRAVKSDMARAKDSNMVSITVTDPIVRQAYQPIVPFLKEIRRRFPDEVAFTEQVLEEHGEWIAMHICEPLGIGEYECMAMAVSVSEEETKEHRISPLPPPV